MSDANELEAWLVSMIDGKNRECPYRLAYERINDLQSRLQACEKYAANLDKLTREQNQAQDAMHKTTIAMRERADQLEKHRERAYEDVANISVEIHELRSRLDSVRCRPAKALVVLFEGRV